MKIYKYSFRNIGPFSNVPTVIDLEGDDADMNMMIGDNGIGKSTTIKALKIGLYHDLAYAGDVKVDEIANDINKNGEIIVELNSRGKDWTIVTNFSPNKIKLYDGRGENADKLLDKGGIPETKKFIRDHILDIPFYIFDNVLSLDVTEFKSLLTLNAEDTRKIRDRIFGFSIFNEMSSKIKKRLNELVENRKFMEYELESQNSQLATIIADIESMKEQVKNELKVDDLKGKLDVAKKDKENITISLDKLSKDLAQANNDFRYYSNKRNQAAVGLLTQEKIEVETKAKQIDSEILEIDESIDKLQSYAEVSSLTNSITQDTESLKEQNNKLIDFKTEYTDIAAKVKEINEKLEVINDHIFITKLKAKYTEYSELKETISVLTKWIAEQSKISNIIRDENTELKTEASSLRSALKARKNGECNECGTKFNKDHSKHIEELEIGIKEIEDKFESNKSKAEKILNELQQKNTELNNAESQQSLLKAEIKAAVIPKRTDITDFESLEQNIKEHQEFWSTKYNGNDAEGDLKKLNTELTELKNRGNKIKDDGNILRGKLVSLKEGITKNQDKLKELKTKFVEQPTGNIAALKEKRASLVTKRNDLSKQENSFDVQIQVINSKINADVTEPIFSEKEVDEKLGTIPELYNEAKSKAETIDRSIFECEKSIEIANNAANLNLQSAHLKKQRKEVEDKIKSSKTELGEHKSNIERQEHLLEIIKRSKDEVLRINIPYINHTVINICKKIGVTQMLTFDDNFVPHIYRANREVSLKSASVGQRKKMNFAVLIAITKFLKLRYGGLNIIFYDEMFSSIAEKGRPHMLEIIRQEIVENLKIEVWITNHFIFPNSQFDNYIIIEEKSGFSHARKIDAGELLSLEQQHAKQQVAA